jgi:translocation and assembly module TamB
VAHLGRAGGPAQPTLPNLDDLVLHLRADRNAATLDSLAAKIEGQELRAAGRVPMDDGRWQLLARRPAAFDWSRVEARIEIPDADLAAVARRLPALPLIQGRLRAVVQRTGDGTLTGEVHLRDGISRPVDPLGVVQAIHGDLTLTERTLAIHGFGATLGGEPVTLAGNAAFPAHGDPRFALRLKGANLPIVRRAGLLLRTDLDLRADTDAAGGTRVTGTVNLRDCLVLADLRELLPIGQAGVTRQPPYFAVSVPPFGRWQLAIAVHGPRSVRVRTPVFIGSASPRFQLGGTLAEPRAVGEITVDQGQVFFPFATFQVQIGAIRLPESDPYHPQLTLHAVSNRQDYQLRLEASGPPDAPNITFSSNPPMEASQVLLLVTTGQPPTNERTGTTDQQRLARLGTYLGKGLFGGLAGGDEGRLELNAGNQTSRQGRDTYEVDYRLSDRWSLVGEYDEFDDYNAGLKWRVYSDEGGEREKK